MRLTNESIKNNKRWMYVLLGILIMICFGTVYSWSIFRIPIEKLYGIGSTQSGLPYMTSLAFYSLFMLLTGRVLDRYSPRLIISTGALLIALGWILSAFAPNIYILTITYGVIIGTGVGIAYGVPMSIVAKWFPEKKGFAVGLVLIGFGLSPLFTAPLARRLLEEHGVMSTFLILGISFGILIPLLSIALRYPDTTDNINSQRVANKNKSDDIDTANMVKSYEFKGLYLNFIIGTMIGLTLIGLTSSIGVEYIKISPNIVAVYMSLFAIFNGVGRPIYGWLTDKLSTKKSMLISYGLIILASILMIFAKEGNIILFAIAFSIFWFNLGGWLAIAPASTLDMFGTKHYSQNYGVVFTAYGIGAIIGVLASGMLVDFFGHYNSVFYFVFGLCIIGILLVNFYYRET